MKKIVIILVLFFSATTLFAQDKIALFVYSTTKLNVKINALRSNIEGALVNSADKKYIVVDRTEEFNRFLEMEYGYQEEGYVSNAQLITAGDRFGANKVCGVVISDYGDEGYFIECKILDVQKNQIDATARYPNRSGERVIDLGIASSEKVAISLAAQLNLLSIDQKDQEEKKIKKEEDERKKREADERQRKEEEKRRKEADEWRKKEDDLRAEMQRREDEWRRREEKRKELLNNPYFQEEKNKYIAWSVVGGSYPWGLTTGIESRFGGIMGFGLYADFGFCFTDITVEDYDSYYHTSSFENITKTMIKYVGGIKFYPYKGLFVDCGFGTISKPEEDIEYDYIKYSYIDADEREDILRKVSISHGIFFHIGYDYVGDLSDGGGGFIGISGGASYDITNKMFLPSINLKIGYAWGTK